MGANPANTKLCDFTHAPGEDFIRDPISSPIIQGDSFEISPSLLNLIYKEQFGGIINEDASMYLHDFCDMQKI